MSRRSAAARRATAATLATVHAGSLAGAGALVLTEAGATGLRPILVVCLGLVAIGAVRWPGSAAGLVAIVGTVASYVVVSTLGIALDQFDGPSTPRVLLLAACLYVAHATDALRGFAPGADLDASVLARWLRRLAEALVPGVLVGALVLGLRASDGASPLWLVGAVAVLAAAAVPALRVQRRPWRKPVDPPSSGDSPQAAREP